MSATHTWVKWNRAKITYDVIVAGGLAIFLAAFVGVGVALPPSGHAHDPMVLLIRALAIAAITLLHVVLCIGPLARLIPSTAPLLYNRRHLGVTTFLVALAHAGLVLLYYGAFGSQDPVTAVVAAPIERAGPGGFPFEVLGFGALVILFVLAATSHDFWNFSLGPRIWKSIHMLVYVAYALAIGHVALGVLQDERDPAYVAMLVAGVALVGGLHAVSAIRGALISRAARADTSEGDWIDAGPVEAIPLDGARTVPIPGRERVAIYRYKVDGEERVGAMSNVCAHQGGPLGEGRVIGGCLTCPWHGWQYEPETGHSPPPYAERVPTHEVRVDDGRVWIKLEARPTDRPAGGARTGGGDG